MLQEREAPGTVRASAESATLANVRPGAVDANADGVAEAAPRSGAARECPMARPRGRIRRRRGGFRGSSDKSTRVGNLLLDG